ncbi:hypothetical protein UFOVP824_34 [uncultured Caudovirales phage]|uniref:Uncharacterized protein n=1 Tax=uncultured Caudovirales phage TaxID=2100421 RepID=A0A6J5PC48_9CAUD|nr:hypothetical protein UFOVP824_34 [uncultured Caudovirales phage]
MNPSILFQILERFPQSKWAMTSSAKHKEALKKLEEFGDDEIAEALDVMKRTLARTLITPDQLAAEIKMMRKRTRVNQKQLNDVIIETQVEQDRVEMRADLANTPEELIRAAVKFCRSVSALDIKPLSRNITEWSDYTVGMVWAAVQREKEMQQ